MLDWLGREGDRLQHAFRRVFGDRFRPFGSRSTRGGGLSDGTQGVQWNAGIDGRHGVRWMGVNLEGMQYDGWPVARLITRELEAPSLVPLVHELGDTGPIELEWRRDYWQATGRPAIREREIRPTPILLSRLSESAWRQALTEALECLSAERGYRGRAIQTVTLAASGREVEGPVSPHLTISDRTTDAPDWEDFLREGRAKLQPLYDWTVERAAAGR